MSSKRWFPKWCITFSFLPVKKLSTTITWSPLAISLSTRWLPTNPAPPVTTTRSTFLFNPNGIFAVKEDCFGTTVVDLLRTWMLLSLLIPGSPGTMSPRRTIMLGESCSEIIWSDKRNSVWRRKKADAIAIPSTTKMSRCSFSIYSIGCLQELQSFAGGFAAIFSVCERLSRRPLLLSNILNIFSTRFLTIGKANWRKKASKSDLHKLLHFPTLASVVAHMHSANHTAGVVFSLVLAWSYPHTQITRQHFRWRHHNAMQNSPRN